MTLYPAPKPSGGKRAPKGLKRTRMKQRNAKRKGSAFPKQRDDAYRAFIRGETCLLLGHDTAVPLSVNDIPCGRWKSPVIEDYRHVCWGPTDAAHVGEHRATGAPDVGATVPLCRAAHAFYDEHRDQWPRVTGYSERKMALAASGYALKYVESGGLRAGTDPQ